MNAILWDGNKQLNGSLEFEEKRLIFKMKYFSRQHLNTYGDIAKVSHYKIYQLVYQAIEITSMDSRRNVFVVDEPMVLKRFLEKKIKMQSIIVFIVNLKGFIDLRHRKCKEFLSI